MACHSWSPPCGLSLVTVEHLPSRTAKHLVHTLERVFRIYAAVGFVIQVAMMDIEFEKLKTMMTQVALNTTVACGHIGEVEQKIRLIMERARGTFNTLLYKKLPNMMVIELLHFCIMWMNSFPVKSGISKNGAHGSWYLVTRWMLNYTAGLHLDHIVSRGSSSRFAKISNDLFDPKKCLDMLNLLT